MKERTNGFFHIWCTKTPKKILMVWKRVYSSYLPVGYQDYRRVLGRPCWMYNAVLRRILVIWWRSLWLSARRFVLVDLECGLLWRGPQSPPASRRRPNSAPGHPHKNCASVGENNCSRRRFISRRRVVYRGFRLTCVRRNIFLYPIDFAIKQSRNFDYLEI